MSSKTEVVQIQRGRYSPRFQVIRAWLSAASAMAGTDKGKCVEFLDEAIVELSTLRTQLSIAQMKEEGTNAG